MKRPLPPDLLAWFLEQVKTLKYEGVQYQTTISPNTISGIKQTGTASAGIIATLERWRAGETIREPNMQERQDIAWEALETMIASAFEALPPRRRRAMMKRLGPAVAEDWAIRSGALKPLPPTGNV